MTPDENTAKDRSSTQAYQDCVIAEYRSMEKAELALEVLATDGFTTENVSRISLDPEASQTAEPENHPLAKNASEENVTSDIKLDGRIPDQVRGNPDEQKANRAAGVGAVIGGALATPIAMGSLVGPFFVVGPLLGLGLGAAVGGLFGAVERWGVRRDVAADYEKNVRNGSVLVLVTDSPQRLHEAYKLLQTSGPFSLERFRVPT